MSLRRSLGADTGRVHEQVDALLDSEDAMIVLVDRSRAISYAAGFGISPCQLELVVVEIERVVREVGGPSINHRRNRRNHGEGSDERAGSCSGAGIRQHSGRIDRRRDGRLVDRRGESVRIGGTADSGRGIAAGRVLRLAREASATEAG